MKGLSRKPGVAGLALFSVLPVSAMAQDVLELAQTLAADPWIPAAVVGWVDATEMDFAVSGVRMQGGDDPVARDDAWHLGSITKSMTALLAAQLVAAGDMSWATTFGPDDGPSLQDLLRHTSGLPPNPPAMRLAFLSRDWQADHAEARRMLANAALGRRAATQTFNYSNLGYIAAGQMLADAAEVEWEALIQSALFEPLSLSTAGFGAPGLIWGHNEELLPQEPGPFADNAPALAPAGGVHMAPVDVLAYLRAHLLRDPDLLPPALWETLHTPTDGADYAMGWVQLEGGTLWHNGSNTFWYAEVAIDHNTGRAGFVAVNSGALQDVTDPVSDALTAVMVP